MADNNTGQGFVNIAGGIGSLLQGLGGTNGIGDDIGDIICNAKGNCQPKNVTIAQPVNTNTVPSYVWIIGVIMLVVVLIIALRK